MKPSSNSSSSGAVGVGFKAVAAVCLTAGALAMLAGCSGHRVDRAGLRVDGRMPAVKPAGVIVEREEDEFEVGPPPYGYIKIIGEPMPNWDPEVANGFSPRALSWEFIGPKPMASEYWSGNGNAGGHIAAIAPHPTNASICYIASDTGGVWKTTNGGTNWTPLTDTLSIMNHGALAVDPQNPETVYAGTGSLSTGNTGDGLFRSLDGGTTWSRIATTAQVGVQISGIAVDPTNSNIIHVTGNSGYHRSLDGGATWSVRQNGTHNSLAINPATPSTLYVGRSGQGVYKSTDGGNTLTKLAGGLPASGFSSTYVRLANSNPNVLYAVLLSGGGLQGLYRSADAGATWVKKTATPNFPEYGNYACFLGVSPTNENTIFCGGVDPRYATAGIIRSINGGDTWLEISDGPSQVHPDHHCIAFGPGGTVWQGNDGGIYKSTNNGDNWTNVNSTLAAGQIYNLVQHPTLTNRVLGGTQDNGTPEKASASLSWNQLQVGDGGFSVFDPSTTTNRRYTTYVYLDITRWSNTGGAGITGPWGSDPTNFIAPLVGDPNSATTLLGGTNRIWRTTNATSSPPTWTAISTNAVGAGGTINAIAVANGASNTIYSGSSTGKVYVTTDATTWNARSTGLPNGQISDIVISPTDPGTAYVSYYNTTGNRVLKTTNFGVNWTGVTGTLPSGARANALAIDWSVNPPAMYVGAGAGVYFSLDNGGTWTKNGSEFPNVNVGDLFIDPIARTITAGTYGRGAWRAPLPAACPADFNRDGFVSGDDFDQYVAAFEAGSAAADFNGDGFVSGDDFDAFSAAFEAGC